MLSKVLSHRAAADVQTLVFPSVLGVDVARARAVRPPEAGTSGEPEAAALREKLRQTENEAAAEQRRAFEAGRQQGQREAQAELQPVIERLNASIAEIVAMRPDLRRRAERDVVQLALMIARRVLHRELSVDQEALTAIARLAFERLARSESYRVIVHPRFAAAVTSAVPPNHAARVHIEPDPECAPGTLIIHSAEGAIDASVDAQVEEISRGLADRLVTGEAR
jgi:flagellar assembly protein FliH